MSRRRVAAALGIFAALAAVPFLVPFLRGDIFLFRDHLDYFAPLRWFTAETLRRGLLPLWNPYSGSGERWLANPQTGVFYPPTLIFLLLSFPRAYLLFLWFHLALLGCGSFLFFKRWSSGPAAMVGAAGMMLAGPTLSLLDVNNNLASLSWLPWILGSACDLREWRRAAMVPAAFLLAMAFLGGEPLFALIGWMLFALIALWGRLELFSRVAGSLLLAAGLASVQLVPFLELLNGSDRSGGLDPALAFAQSLAPRDWLSVTLSPAVFGLPLLSQTFIPSLFLGLPLVAAISLRLFMRRFSHPELAAFVALGLFGLVAAGRTVPGIAALSEFLHLNASRHPARLAPLVTFALLVLAVGGVERLQSAPLRLRIAAGSVPLILTLAAAPLFLSIPPSGAAMMESAAAAVLTFLLFAIRPGVFQSSWPAAIALTIALAADLLYGGWFFFGSGTFDGGVTHSPILASSGTKVARLGEPESIGPLHLFSRTAWLSGYLNLYDGVFDLSSAAPVIPRAYDRFMHAAVDGGRRDLLDFAGVGFLLAPSSAPPPRALMAGRSGDVALYRNGEALPLLSLWGNYREVATDGEALGSLIDHRSDPRVTIMLTRPPAPFRSLRSNRPGGDSRFDLRYSVGVEGVVAAVRASRPAILVITQNDAPGWEASLDGHPAVTARCDGLFRAVFVPQGQHHVEWRYRPRSLGIGVFFSVASLVAVAAWATMEWNRKVIRRPVPDDPGAASS